MPIMLKRKNGAGTPFRNAEYLPAYYFIPASVLAQCGTELNSVPRNPRKLISAWDAIATVESDLFRSLIIDAYAFMVWLFMCPGVKREIYSGYEPTWIFAHSPAYWVQKLQDEKIIPTAENLFKDGGVDVDFGYVQEEEIEALFRVIVPQVMDKYKMQEVMDIAREYRCFEDFDFQKAGRKRTSTGSGTSLYFCICWQRTTMPCGRQSGKHSGKPWRMERNAWQSLTD